MNMNKKLLIALLFAGTSTALYCADQLHDLIEEEEENESTDQFIASSRPIPRRVAYRRQPSRLSFQPTTAGTANAPSFIPELDSSFEGTFTKPRSLQRRSSAPSFGIPQRKSLSANTNTEDITKGLSELKQLITLMKEHGISTPDDNIETLTSWILSQNDSYTEVTKIISAIKNRIRKSAEKKYAELNQLIKETNSELIKSTYQQALDKHIALFNPIAFLKSLQTLNDIQRPLTRSTSPRPSSSPLTVRFSPEPNERNTYSPTFDEYRSMHGVHQRNLEEGNYKLNNNGQPIQKKWFKEYEAYRPETHCLELEALALKEKNQESFKNR